MMPKVTNNIRLSIFFSLISIGFALGDILSFFEFLRVVVAEVADVNPKGLFLIKIPKNNMVIIRSDFYLTDFTDEHRFFLLCL